VLLITSQNVSSSLLTIITKISRSSSQLRLTMAVHTNPLLPPPSNRDVRALSYHARHPWYAPTPPPSFPIHSSFCFAPSIFAACLFNPTGGCKAGQVCHVTLSQSLLASAAVPQVMSKYSTIELYDTSQVVESKSTGMLTFRWSFSCPRRAHEGGSSKVQVFIRSNPTLQSQSACLSMIPSCRAICNLWNETGLTSQRRPQVRKGLDSGRSCSSLSKI
jgi:hypothetical protein